MLITSTSALEEQCQALAGSKFIAIDTEFLRDKTYYPILSLIQIGNGKTAFAVDMLKNMDFAPLMKLLGDEKLIKVIHSSRQDVEVLHNKFNFVPKRIFDTQVACQMNGYHEQLGYEKFIDRYLGKSINKQLQFSDWTKRPITQAQLDYALDDVIYLAEAFPLLYSDIEKRGRVEWVFEESNAYGDTPRFYPDDYELLKKFIHRHRTEDEFAKCLLIIRMREEHAKKFDVTRSSIVGDNDLVEAVNKRYIRIKKIPSLFPFYFDVERIIHSQSVALSEEDKKIIQRILQLKSYTFSKGKAFEAIRKLQLEIEENEGISMQLLGSSQDISSLIHRPEKFKLMRNWRYEIFGKAALEIIESCKAEDGS